MTKEQEIQKDNRMVTGSSWMTFGSLVSRMLGAIYIIPWMAWMGTQAQADSAHALFQVAYNPYALFLAIATAGVPSSISKQVSHFNALEEYEVSKKIYKQGLFIMVITGVVSAVLLYVIAPTIAAGSAIADVDSATFVIRSLVPALLLIPSQAVTRGLFQGHGRMREPAISQIIEQLMRILFILGSAYTIRQILSGEVVTAVGYSTFAAFIGALFSFGYLLIRLKKVPTALNREVDESKNLIQVSTPSIFKQIIITAIPFVIMSTGIIIMNLIDQQTISPIMHFFNESISDETIQQNFGIISANAYKLSTIIAAFGSALAITSVPLMSELVSKKQYRQVAYQFEQSIQLLMFIMIPAVIGMFVVAEPFYTIFYGYNEFGVVATRVYAVTSLFIGAYLVLGNIIQSVNLRRAGIYALGAGILTKFLMQPIFLSLMGEIGMLYSTMVALTVTILLMMRSMHKFSKYSVTFLIRRNLLILILSLVMGLVTYGTSVFLGLFIDYGSRFQSLIALLLIGVVGMLVYAYLTLKTRLAESVIGPQAKKLRRKLRIK